MDQNNIINALNTYDGTQPSLEKTVLVLENELGANWTETVFEQLGGLSVELKEKLNHAFNYYASLTAWQEAQSYLNQTEPLDDEIINERLPVLQHWLDFFGEPGQNLYQQLEERCHQQFNTQEPLPKSDEPTSEQPIEEDVEALVQEEPVVENESFEEKVDPVQELPQTQEILPEDDEGSFDHSDEKIQEKTSEENTPEGFAVQKAKREIALLDDLQSWLAARCLQLGDIENFAYPYYGLVVDLMRQVVKDIQSVLDLENQEVIARYYPDGLEELKRKKQAVEADIQTAVENCESNTTALIEEGMDLNKVKKTLGDLDESTEKEYLGPAPDGFELMDDKPIDEQAVKEQYEQLEETTQKNTQKQDISVTDEKKTSQNEQNGVQRKLSFSLKPKKG